MDLLFAAVLVALIYGAFAAYRRGTYRCWNCRQRLWNSALVCSHCARRQRSRESGPPARKLLMRPNQLAQVMAALEARRRQRSGV
jgi:hypothetical protein